MLLHSLPASLERVKRLYAKAFSECGHPFDSIVERFLSTTTNGTAWCLDCGAQREQNPQDGQWREWREGTR